MIQHTREYRIVFGSSLPYKLSWSFPIPSRKLSKLDTPERGGVVSEKSAANPALPTQNPLGKKVKTQADEEAELNEVKTR